jgi:nucleoid DNA-binding protein
MEISKYISELLFDHECVIIPGFGGFVANYQAATIHPVQHRFDPPSKSILFNTQLKHNDGLLASYVATAHTISYSQAMERVGEFAFATLHAIDNGQKVLFENLGVLYADASGHITFEQDKKVNYLHDVYGMESFISPAISRQIQRPKPIAPKPQSVVITNNKNQITPVLLRLVAGVSIVFILSFLGYSLLSDNHSFVNLSGFLPFGNRLDNPQHQLVNGSLNDPREIFEETPDSFVELTPENAHQSDATDADFSFNDELSEKIIESSEPIATGNDQVEIVQMAVVQSPSPKMYHLIAGSFLENENAGNLIEFYQNNGYMPIILGPADNGYFRVSIAAYLRKDEALEELNLVRSQFNPNVWLLRQ